MGIVQAVVLLFAGSWSDRVGLRKPCILVPIAADIVAFGGEYGATYGYASWAFKPLMNP